MDEVLTGELSCPVIGLVIFTSHLGATLNFLERFRCLGKKNRMSLRESKRKSQKPSPVEKVNKVDDCSLLLTVPFPVMCYLLEI